MFNQIIVETKDTKELSNQELSVVREFLIKSFKHDHNYKHVVYTNQGLYKCIRMFTGDELIGHILVVQRQIQINGNNFRVGGLGDLAVSPEHRHRGRGLELMRAASKLLANEFFDCGLFFCDPSHFQYFMKVGWIPKAHGKIIYHFQNKAKYQKSSCILPLNLTQKELYDWHNEDVFIGEGTW
ncbi:GNAT family N-acetyltransferase [Pseudomonadota bacterium]